MVLEDTIPVEESTDQENDRRFSGEKSIFILSGLRIIFNVATDGFPKGIQFSKKKLLNEGEGDGDYVLFCWFPSLPPL